MWCMCLTNNTLSGILVYVQVSTTTTTLIDDNSTPGPNPPLGVEQTPQPVPTASTDPPQFPVANFPDSAPTSRCSENVCANGHGWIPEIQTAQCAGCKCPIVLVRMVNCPTCNEPVDHLRFRSDHLPAGGVVTPICRGSASLAEVSSVEITRLHAQTEEEQHKKRELPKKV